MDEHRFIVQELLWQDPQHRKWYFGGRQQSPGYWVNEVDGTSLKDLESVFLPESNRDIGVPNRDYLAYRCVHQIVSTTKLYNRCHLSEALFNFTQI